MLQIKYGKRLSGPCSTRLMGKNQHNKTLRVFIGNRDGAIEKECWLLLGLFPKMKKLISAGEDCVTPLVISSGTRC